MRISDWSSDVCSSDLDVAEGRRLGPQVPEHALGVCKVDPLLPGLPPVRCSRRAEDLIFETDLQPGVAVRARTVGGEDRRIGGKIGQAGMAGGTVIGRKARKRVV